MLSSTTGVSGAVTAESTIQCSWSVKRPCAIWVFNIGTFAPCFDCVSGLSDSQEEHYAQSNTSDRGPGNKDVAHMVMVDNPIQVALTVPGLLQHSHDHQFIVAT